MHGHKILLEQNLGAQARRNVRKKRKKKYGTGHSKAYALAHGGNNNG